MSSYCEKDVYRKFSKNTLFYLTAMFYRCTINHCFSFNKRDCDDFT